MRLKILAELIDKISDKAIIESKNSKSSVYIQAMNFFKNGKLPDGTPWGKPLNFRFGYDNSPEITREILKDTSNGKIYSARLFFAPGKGGGSGMTIDATASNQLFNMLGSDPKTIKDVEKAFYGIVKGKSRILNNMVLKYLQEEDNFLYHIVGWENRDQYRISDITFRSISYGKPMVDPTRRKWPSGRTEIWIPITADVIVKLKEKK